MIGQLTEVGRVVAVGDGHQTCPTFCERLPVFGQIPRTNCRQVSEAFRSQAGHPCAPVGGHPEGVWISSIRFQESMNAVGREFERTQPQPSVLHRQAFHSRRSFLV